MAHRSIPFVTTEPVFRKLRIPAIHQVVPHDLGKDGRRGDGGAQGIPLNDPGLIEREPRDRPAIDQYQLRRLEELGERGTHGIERGLEDIEGIDGAGFHNTDPKGQRRSLDDVGELSPSGWGELFAVTESCNNAIGGENHRRGDDRPRPRAAAGFINTGDHRAIPAAPGAIKRREESTLVLASPTAEASRERATPTLPQRMGGGWDNRWPLRKRPAPEPAPH